MHRCTFAALGLLAWVLVAGAQQLSYTPFHASGIYDLDEPAGWKFTQPADAPAATYKYAVRKNNRVPVKSGTLEFTQGTASLEVKLDEPAMLYVEVTAEGVPPLHLGAAVAPRKIPPAAPKPADFDRFWDGKLKDLARIPMNPALTPGATEQAGVELYTVKLDSLGTNVRGYLAKPAREGRFPALVLYQYAGVYALQPKWVTDRAAEGWLTFDVDSHDIPPDTAEGVANNYPTMGNTNREASYFLYMYLRDSRALDYIRTRPDWDGKTIVLMGTSMGGQQSLVTAGLNPKVTAVIVNEPSGTDANGDLHGRKAGYPNWPSSNPDVMATAVYFDPVHFASRIQAPVLCAIGFIDTTSPPAGIWAAMNQVPGPVEVISMVESDHNNRTPEKQGDWVTRSREVLNELMAMGEYRAR